MELVDRFRGYLPVVVDLETGGFDAQSNPLLELACVMLDWQDNQLVAVDQHAWCVAPFAGSSADPASLKVTGIDLEDPNRRGLEEHEVVREFFGRVRTMMKAKQCTRAILVAHNAAFDHNFLNAAVSRCEIKRSPFHPFSTIDTASLAAVAYGHTVLSEACRRAGIDFNNKHAHRAAYDATCTAQLFCKIVNESPFEVPAD